METRIVNEDEISSCAELIQKGEVVAFPTETVYGLGADALNENAVKKIFEAKNRPSDNPFIVHLPDLQDIDKVAYLTKEAEKVFEIFSPGPITVVLKKKKTIPGIVTAGLDSVGVRIPSHPIARRFLKACGTPIAAPSANLSKKVSPTTAERVFEDMNGRIPMILDGGMCDVGIESTVIDLSGETAVLLRPGAITEEMLLPYLKTIKHFEGKITVAPAPGMKYAHYCPTAECVLFSGLNSCIEEYTKQKNNGRNPIVLGKEDSVIELKSKNINAVSLGKDGQAIAHNVFEFLRKYEKTNDYILLEALPNKGIEKSIMNRITKSAGGKII